MAASLLAPLPAIASDGPPGLHDNSDLPARPLFPFLGGRWSRLLRSPWIDEVPPTSVGRSPFLWGVAMSSYQNDGAGPAMDWYALERSGRLPDTTARGPDFRGHLDGDLDLAKSIGLNAFRTSIEWARIEPVQGQIDRAEVAYVHRLLKGLRKRGMTPVIALHHFATPNWVFQDSGDGLLGWESTRTVEAYWRYVDFVVKEFGQEIEYYITFNEPSTLIGGAYFLGWTVPHRQGPMPTYRATVNIMNAHIGAYERIHAVVPRAKVSIAEYNCFFPMPSLFPALAPKAGEFAKPTENDSGLYYMPSQILSSLLDKARGWDGKERVKYLDYLALHYYGSVDAAAATAFPVTPYRWGVHPEHLGRILHAYHETYKLPIMVAENGFATRNGEPRPDGWTRESYLVAHVKEIDKARAEGVPVIGYLYWTLTDNFEWGTYDPRFGLWRVDARQGDLRRQETPAVPVFREIVKKNGVTEDLARRFPPPDAPGPPKASAP